jgi:hypothetical protein
MAVDFLNFDDESLLLQVGQRAALAETRPDAANLPTEELAVEYEHLSLASDAKVLGRRIARRVARELHQVLCGNEPDDAQDREKLRSALGLSDQAVVAAVAAVLAGPLGLGGAIAAALAALFVKRLFAPTIEETCQFWEEKIAAT